MYIAARKKVLWVLVIILSLLCISVVLYSFILYYPNLQSRKLLEKYKWEVLNGGRSEEESIILSNDYLESEITMMQINASTKIGLNPKNYVGKSIKKYYYTLKQTDKNIPLRAEIWICRNKIICAYILHAESNVRIRFWSLDTPFQRILSELNELKQE